MRTLLLLAVLIFHCDDLQNLYPSSDTIIEGQLDWQKQFYFDRINEFKNEPIGKNKIVFLGNSIVKGGGNWNEKYELNN